MIEMVEQLKAVVMQSKQYREITETNDVNGEPIKVGYLTTYSLQTSVTLIGTSLMRCFTSLAFILRTSVLMSAATVYFSLRKRLHGENMLYKWTIMENHVHHLPAFYERALSYAQYHYLYLWKLLYPAGLCFDYGYACVPTVHTLADWNNVKPLIAYSCLLGLALLAVYRLRVNIMMGLVLLVVPLTPALNIFVPVGALFAERLLFIPSIGFSILLGELLAVDAAPLWEYLYDKCSPLWRAVRPKHSTVPAQRPNEKVVVQNEVPITPDKKVRFQSAAGNNKKKANTKDGLPSPPPATSSVASFVIEKPMPPVRSRTSNSKRDTKSPKSRGTFLVYVVLVPVLLWCGCRVVSRNNDWRDEYSLFKSGLDVCPQSLKVLTNYALLAMSRQQYDVALESALTAVEIYPEQMAALINAGVAYQKMGRYQESVELFQRCLRVDPNMAKAAGYLGCSYYYWAGVQSEAAAAEVLRNEALKWFYQAIDAGFQAPLILHLTGSTLIDLGKSEESLRYYEAALQQSGNYASYYQTSSTVPILLEDDIQPAATLNQLGSAYWALHRGDEAENAFRRGLEVAPDNIPLLTNLGNVYRERGDTARARQIMQEAIKYSGDQVPPALLNNLGLLELNVGNFRVALDHFQQAMHMLVLSNAMSGVGNSVALDGSGAEAIIKENIRRAERGIHG